MTAGWALFKTLALPPLISCVLYLLLSYVVLPFLRQHRNRYNHYLPLNALSARTSSLRRRIFDGLVAMLLPSTWARARRSAPVDGSDGLDEDDGLFDDEDGEGMVGFDVDAQRREALERRRSGACDGGVRLSRDLEEGFRDDSDDDEDEQLQDRGGFGRQVPGR